MAELLAGTLTSLGIDFEFEDGIFSVWNKGDHPRIVGLLRQVFSGPEREAVGVCELRDRALPVVRDLDHWWRLHETEWFEGALAGGRFEIWFQPVVDTNTRQVYGHECLIRLPGRRVYGGGEILEAAKLRNRIHEFDSHARRLAIVSAARQGKDGRYFINFTPSSIYNPEFCMRATMEALAENEIKPENIVFEVVESELVRDAAHLRRIRDYCGSHGFGFALDDLGTGVNSLKMIGELRPEYVKIHKSLVQNVERPTCGATVRKLVDLADQFSVRVIAKGVETIHTTENLWLLGAEMMQGYLFGRPSRNVVGAKSGLLRLAGALEPGDVRGKPPMIPVSTSCRPGSAVHHCRQESPVPSLVVR